MGFAQVTVATHPQISEINRMLAENMSFRAIAATLNPPLHYTAIQRYAKRQAQQIQQMGRSATESNGYATKDWVEREYINVYAAATEGKRKDLPSARAALDSISRLKGFDAPKRTESVSLNLHALGSGALAEQLAAALHQLPENERKSLAKTIDIPVESDTSE